MSLFQKIDEFLNRNVKYIVTNRPKNVWPQRESVINSNNNKFGLSLETYQSINSPIAKNNSNKNSDLFVMKFNFNLNAFYFL